MSTQKVQVVTNNVHIMLFIGTKINAIIRLMKFIWCLRVNSARQNVLKN